MSFLPGEIRTNGKFEVCCINCGVTVDIIPLSEIPYLGKYLAETNQQVYCFDCEGQTEADCTPLALIPPLFGSITIDNEIMIADADTSQSKGGVFVIESESESMRLSSKPQFNTLSKNA